MTGRGRSRSQGAANVQAALEALTIAHRLEYQAAAAAAASSSSSSTVSAGRGATRPRQGSQETPLLRTRPAGDFNKRGT